MCFQKAIQQLYAYSIIQKRQSCEVAAVAMPQYQLTQL